MMHRLLRIVAPFLYVRNWYNGQYELSLFRTVLVGIVFILFCFVAITALVLGQPVTYTNPS